MSGLAPPGGPAPPAGPPTPPGTSYPWPTASPAPATPLDAVSIVALVASATCCAAPAGMALGVWGVRRTSGGQRAGRWLAVLAIVVGALGTAAAVLVQVALAAKDGPAPTAATVTTGTCLDLERRDDDLRVATTPCGGNHDVEIVHTGAFDDSLLAAYGDGDASAFCHPLLGATHQRAARSGRYAVGVLVDALDPDVPTSRDAFACYFTGRDGARLDGPVPREEEGS